MIFNKNDMNKANLLKELDILGYSARAKKIAILGRNNKGLDKYSKLLLSLLKDGEYEGKLALVGAAVTKDEKVVLAALKHPKASVRNKATGLLVKVASDYDIKDIISRLSYECRLKLLRSISKSNRQQLAEELITLVYNNWGAKEAAILLPACSEESVKKWLLDIGYIVVNWKKLAYNHPDAVAKHFKMTLQDTSPSLRGYVWWRFSSAIDVLANLKGELILECAIKLGPMDIIHPVLKKQLGILVCISPDTVYELLIRNESRGDLLSNGLPRGVLKRRTRLSKEQWIELAKLLRDNPVHIAEILNHNAPSEREEIFEAVYEKNECKNHVFTERLLGELPHVLREREAARMLKLREISENKGKVTRITAYLSIKNSRMFFENASKASNAEERAFALAQLVKGTGLSRSGVQETLTFLRRIKNDQDIVRNAVIGALSNCSPTIFSEENVKDLDFLVDSIIEARDTSYATQFVTQKLALSIMKYNAFNTKSEMFRFSIRTIIKLAKQNGQLNLPSLEENLPRGIEKKIFAEIYPLVVEENKKENYKFVIDLADSLGKRGEDIVELQNLLHEAINASCDDTVVQAVKHWLAPKKTRDERVKELLLLDKSFITINEVFSHLHIKRQEWLDPFIYGRVIKGRFLTGKTIYLVPACNGFNRWLPRQQKSFSLLLEKISFDSKRNLWERSESIRKMAKMPDSPMKDMLELLKNSDIYIIETALYALSLIEEPEIALTILLENLDGDRARIAMYSIPRCIRKVNPDLLTKILKELLSRDKLKITVRKEVIRLLGAYKNSDSIMILINEFKKVNLHKDVIIAIGHAARKLLDYEQAWNILGEIASSQESDIAKSLLNQQPNELPRKYRERYLKLVIKLVNHIDDEVGREAYNCIRYWTNGNEEIIASVALETILDLNDSVKWKSAMEVLIYVCHDGKVNRFVLDTYKTLAGVKLSDKWNANKQRDLPSRQRLMRLTDRLTSLNTLTRLKLTPLYKDIIDCIDFDETLRSISIKFYIASINWDNVEEAISYINSLVKCIENQPRLLSNAYDAVARKIEESKGYWKQEILLKIVDTIWLKGSHQDQFIALSLLEVVGKGLFWNSDCIERLRAYRNHSNVEIRSLALDIWVAIE
ncbi:HEAT repeat domain-containing protein [Clostridium sp. YIM B02505]|uniref:HEAT repeat domain-containing protein n=2 Tax=Clostridium yunnanense TaxID=2800325 RepID=A0ABS1ETS4_9CLOT|nr:HEAT repeat domain-containing protein [Clostridium yunnanense]